MGPGGMKYPEENSQIDFFQNQMNLWSRGVKFLSLLSLSSEGLCAIISPYILGARPMGIFS